MRIKISFSLILFFLVNLCYSQTGVQNSVTLSSLSQVYDYNSQRLLSKKEIEKRMTSPNNLIIPKEYDKLGNPVNFYAISGLDTSGNFDLSPYYNHPEIGENFPPFIAKTINNKKFKLSKLKDKNLVLNFQLMLRAPFAKTDQIKEVEDFVKSRNEIVQVMFTISGEADALQFVKDHNLSSEIIVDAANFSKKYGVFNYPTYMLIDKESKLVGIYSKIDELMIALKEM
mgnify:CR=1 FL=1|tara:strand:- start:1036 stop:1719 length:684 start_codon:yes stop_codon:yes gene_type:complete